LPAAAAARQFHRRHPPGELRQREAPHPAFPGPRHGGGEPERGALSLRHAGRRAAARQRAAAAGPESARVRAQDQGPDQRHLPEAEHLRPLLLAAQRGHVGDPGGGGGAEEDHEFPEGQQRGDQEPVAGDQLQDQRHPAGARAAAEQSGQPGGAAEVRGAAERDHDAQGESAPRAAGQFGVHGNGRKASS